jgi:hypothetical protein
MVGEHIEALGKLQDIAGHVDAGVEIDRHHQFGDRKQAPEDQRQVILAHDHQQHGGSQRQPLQRRQRRVAGLRGPEVTGIRSQNDHQRRHDHQHQITRLFEQRLDGIRVADATPQDPAQRTVATEQQAALQALQAVREGEQRAPGQTMTADQLVARVRAEGTGSSSRGAPTSGSMKRSSSARTSRPRARVGRVSRLLASGSIQKRCSAAV